MNRTIGLPLLVLFSSTLGLQAAPAHHHGLATLSMARDHQQLQVEFTSPVMNLLNEEPSQLDHQQSQKLDAILERLSDSEALFSLQGGKCTLSRAQARSPYSSGSHEHEHKHRKHDAHDDHADHKDVKITYWFQCEENNSIQGIKSDIFGEFPQLTKIQLTWLLKEAGQASLTPDARTITLLSN